MSDRVFGMRRNFALFVFILLYTIAPILSVLLSSAIASTLGCELNEGDVHPCNCFGMNIGGLLTTMFVSGWLALVTLPTGLIAMIAFPIFVGTSAWLKRSRGNGHNQLHESDR